MADYSPSLWEELDKVRESDKPKGNDKEDIRPYLMGLTPFKPGEVLRISAKDLKNYKPFRITDVAGP